MGFFITGVYRHVVEIDGMCEGVAHAKWLWWLQWLEVVCIIYLKPTYWLNALKFIQPSSPAMHDPVVWLDTVLVTAYWAQLIYLPFNHLTLFIAFCVVTFFFCGGGGGGSERMFLLV